MSKPEPADQYERRLDCAVGVGGGGENFTYNSLSLSLSPSLNTAFQHSSKPS